MSFIVRPIHSNDLDRLFDLARQFNFINLPADRVILEKLIHISKKSFAKEISKENGAEYVFALEDTEMQTLVGCSLIIGKHGTETNPHYSYKIEKKEHFSKSIGVGFIHQVLRLRIVTDGPSEIGGLLIDKAYRRRPEKLGRLASLIRFIFMGMFPELFEKEILCELTPPYTAEGRSEFWEALGRRFTGLPYAEADQISQRNKEFIQSLFPKEDIYLSLLDSKARMVLGQVGEETKPAKYLLKKVGFTYLNEVDPFDGGPHYGVNLNEISLVKNLKQFTYDAGLKGNYTDSYFLGHDSENGFRASQCPVLIVGDKMKIPDNFEKDLEIKNHQQIYISKL